MRRIFLLGALLPAAVLAQTPPAARPAVPPMMGPASTVNDPWPGMKKLQIAAMTLPVEPWFELIVRASSLRGDSSHKMGRGAAGFKAGALC